MQRSAAGRGAQNESPLEDGRAERECFVLAALAGHVEAVRVAEAQELVVQLADAPAEMAPRIEAERGHFDQDGIDAVRDHRAQQRRLRLLPQESQRCEAKASADMLHAQALIVGEDGARGDSADVRQLLFDAAEQAIEVLDFVAGIARPVRLAGHGRRARDLALEEPHVKALGQQRDGRMADRLKHVAVELVARMPAWGVKMRQCDELVAVRNAVHCIEAAVFAATTRGTQHVNAIRPMQRHRHTL